MNGFSWIQGMCYRACDEQSYAIIDFSDNSQQVCAPCRDANCKQCFKNIYAPPEQYDQCLTCQETYILM